MSRNLVLVALIGLLAACSAQGGTSNGGSSDGAAPSTVASGSANTASAACGEAFATLGAQEVTSLSDLAELEGVDATIEQCDSIADWSAGAQSLIGEEVNPSTVQLLLEIRCKLPSLADSAVCEEVAAS